jgi:very-short-patch-repair endonuclease
MADARTAIGYWKSMQIPPELTTKDLRTMLGDVREATRLAGQLKDDSTVAFVFPPNDDTESLEGAISALKTKSLVRKAGLEEVVGSALHVMQPSDSWIELAHLYADTIQTLQDMVESESLDLNALAQGSLDETSAQDLQDRVDTLVAHLEDIPEWFAYLRARETADHAGLSDILQSSLDAGIAVDRAAEYVLVRTLIVEAIQTYPELRDALGQTFTALRQEFQNADRRLLEDNRTVLRNDLVRRHVDPGSRVGNRGSWTGEALILNEAGKSTRHISLRDLHRRAGRAMQQLKPCYMMSPLSVAQAIEPGSIHFDVLIIDEASQMRPEDALGSVARADQIIIVGDPKQLPPTAFFDRAEASDEVADEDAVETESILDLAMQQYGRPRRLLWHYRSRHDSLIAFSNKMFYENELQVFPSPDRSGELGVRYTHISGQYQGSVNPAEAALVAERAIALMKSEPHRSLGIVTMNQRQRDLIRLEVERRAVTDRAAQRYMEDWEERLEPFLIKNLETIQGDERDIILISTLYGPDQAGNVYQRFGPINGKTGWRRLNVLFTRAKDRVEVISSLRPSDITSDERTSRGAKAFRDYLDYASSGRIETGNDTGRPPDSDFEVAVATALRNRGYECEPQVGVAGFFIDIGVRDQNSSGRFILGIECDGRSYHSNKAARDRDRLREEVLQRLGWRLHRIWSTDWFADSARELERLISTISSAADMPASRDDGASGGGSPPTRSANFVSTQTIINELPKRVESPVSVDDLLLESDVLKAVRAVLPPGSALEREKLLRSVASRLGQPLGRKLRSTLNKSIAHEVRHGRLAVDPSWSVVRRP